MSRSTSSSDDDIGRFESVALSADMLQQQAERSKEVGRRRRRRPTLCIHEAGPMDKGPSCSAGACR